MQDAYSTWNLRSLEKIIEIWALLEWIFDHPMIKSQLGPFLSLLMFYSLIINLWNIIVMEIEYSYFQRRFEYSKSLHHIILISLIHLIQFLHQNLSFALFKI